MIRRKETFPITNLPLFQQNYLTEDMLLFDIETTGLSSSRDQIYCIGCGYLSAKTIIIELFFAENPSEEKNILEAFSLLLSGHRTVITFNGNTFDIPFVRKKGTHFAENLTCIDLYRTAVGMKTLLRLPSYRQKAVENFLGCSREDRYDGGQLIEFYKKYTSNADPGLLSILLLHNFEDVRGMFDLLGLLSYQQLSGGRFTITNSFPESTEEYHCIADTPSMKKDTAGSRFYDIILNTKYPLPGEIRLISKDFGLFLNCEKCLIRFPIHHGELKHFFSDYENYYYLPDEDYAVHKSVGIFVAPAHRKKATAKTCYAKKESDYISFPGKNKSCSPRKAYQDKNCYLALPANTEDLHTFLCRFFSGFL